MMTSRKPTVGAIVHYQSYGTPGGEYLPEPRAAIITEVKYIADTDALKGLDGVIEMDGNGSKFIQSFAGREFVTPMEDLPKKVLVSVCVVNPTGLFFKEGLLFAETPTPGHWNWPPLPPRREFDDARRRQEYEGTWPAPDEPPSVDPTTGKAMPS